VNEGWRPLPDWPAKAASSSHVGTHVGSFIYRRAVRRPRALR
jgi:hypothetical protein